MPGAFKRASDKRRGKAGKWTGWYYDEQGKVRRFAGSTDKGATLELARAKEAEARLIAGGLVDPKARKAREATGRPIEEHVWEYRDHLLAKGDTAKHANHTRGVVSRLLAKAGIDGTGGLAAGPIQGALGRMKSVDGRSAGTCNFAIQAIKAFIAWLADEGRIQSLPDGLKKVRPYNADADRRRERRALTSAELERLLDAAELGPTIVATRDGRGGAPSHLTGPDRAMLYRLAMWTGFRANELRTLRPECFDLAGDDPAVVVTAAYAKNGQETRQPIPRESVKWLKPWLEDKPVGKPILPVPEKTAKMLRGDLEAAGIPYADARGRVVDFHALRMSYITKLIRDGVNPKLVQRLARHSTVALTLGIYTHVDDDELRRAVEGGG